MQNGNTTYITRKQGIASHNPQCAHDHVTYMQLDPGYHTDMDIPHIAVYPHRHYLTT